MSLPLLASGDQVTLAAGHVRLTVVTVGGGMRELTHRGDPVLDGYGADEVAPGGAGQPLIPWPNRIADGRYEFAGRAYQLPLTEPSKLNAIHGLTRWMPWSVLRHDESSALLGLVLYPQPGYPFVLRIEIEYTVTSTGVVVTTSAMNVGRSPLPYASGFHPYITVGAPLDGCTLEIPAATRLKTDERQIPIGRSAVASSPYDFRSARPIGELHLDTAFTDLVREPDGMARVRLVSPDGRRRVSVWMDSSCGYVMAFTGDTLADQSRRRRGLGVEPMTAAPNAFRSGEGLRVLGPGESARTEWGIEVEA